MESPVTRADTVCMDYRCVFVIWRYPHLRLRKVSRMSDNVIMAIESPTLAYSFTKTVDERQEYGGFCISEVLIVHKHIQCIWDHAYEVSALWYIDGRFSGVYVSLVPSPCLQYE